VLYIKENKLRNFAISDAGMNDLIRPAFYDAYHEIKRHQEEHKSTDQATKVYDIVGPVCESGCYFAKQRELPQLKQGDYLMIGDAGAYGSSMSSNYNSRPRPAEALLMEDGTVKLLRRRESYEELYAQDLP
jgi:diaminopimelate decarboxylase